MLYFIPAWYQQDQWCENEQSWHERHMHTEFDDTVKQIQLFHRSRACPYQIMLLSYAPNFRHFLHRQGVYRAPYWSCFDAIQEVVRKKAAVLSFHQLKWPDHIEFVYTPFVVIAMLGKEKYAQVEFGRDGNPIRIELYKGGEICRRNIYDDRGFVSSTVLYKNGQPFYQDYLMEDGRWKLRHFKQEGHVEVNPQYPGYLLQHQNERYFVRFSKLFYQDMEQVIREVLTSYLALTKRGNVFCVAMHERHTNLLAELLNEKKLILSFFSDRFLDTDRTEVLTMLKGSDYTIADSGETLRRLRQECGVSIKKSMFIPPYDSRMDVGISQQFKMQKILVAVDGIEEEFSQLVCLLGEYLSVNENACICLFTRRADYDRKRSILEQVRRELSRARMEEGWAAYGNNGKVAENNLEQGEFVPVRFFVEQCVDELAVSKCMREQRLLVDLRKVPELFLQVTAISFGIPQIVYTRTEFVMENKNGKILKDIDMLSEALHYYLDGLKNWNRARVYSYELMKEYTTDKLLEKWKEVMDSVGGDSYFTVGKSGLE